MSNDPVITPTQPAGGITAMTGDVTAAGSGSVAAEVVGATGGIFTVRKAPSGDTQIVLIAGNNEQTILGVDAATGQFYIQNNGVTGLKVYGDAGTVQLAAMAFFGEYQAIRTMVDIACGTQTPDASAILLAESTTQGFLMPRMTTTQKNAIATPTEGLMVYDTTLHAPCWWNGSVWKTVTGS